MNNLITIFTPTYNRRESLKKCYQSLIRQSSKDFLWMIIDDGSTDGTDILVQGWISEKLMPIEYRKKENGGKASAINLSLQLSNTELWMCLDSDDYLTVKAIEIILLRYEAISLKKNICGFLALRSNKDGNVMNNQKRIPEHIEYSTLKHIRYELGIETEYAIVFKTKIAQQYPYPIIEGEKFMPLSYVYDQIDLKYQYKIIHENVMVCEYISEGMTKNKTKIIKKNPKGYGLFNRQRIVVAPNKKYRFKAILLYGAACILDRDSGFLKCVKNSPTKLLSLCLYPLSWIIYLVRFWGKGE